MANATDHLWMHFTRMASYSAGEVPTIVRGEGAYVWDAQGRRYLDGLAGLFVVNAGHGRTELAEAAAKQAGELAYFPLWSYAHPKAIELAERIAALTPGDLNRIFFTTGGSEAVEAAWKLARAYFKRTGKPNKYKVISRYIAYHGTHGRPVDHRPAGHQERLRAAGAGRDQGAEHELLPGARARRRPRGVRPLGRRRDRSGHRTGGAGHCRRGLPGAGTELRRVLPTPARLLRAGTGDLRPRTTYCSSRTR